MDKISGWDDDGLTRTGSLDLGTDLAGEAREGVAATEDKIDDPGSNLEFGPAGGVEKGL